MGSIPPELSLDCKPAYIPNSISEFLREVSMIGNVSERLTKLDDFLKRLQDEMRKIDAFKRELPLCMLLLNDAILAVKDESQCCRKSKAEPVLEQFIPINRTCDDDEKDEISKERDCKDNKKNWLSSVQLWNSDYCPNSNINCNKQNSTPDVKKRADEVDRPGTNDLYESCKNRMGGWSFMPFKGYSSFPFAALRNEDKEEVQAAGLSLVTPGIKNPRVALGSNVLSSKPNSCRTGSSAGPNVQSNLRTCQQQQQTARKQRRCWSPELHRRFVNALHQLGGSQAATPKQIRELMQVDGLTNDEVKSHLQKYRLHIQRLPHSNTTLANEGLGGLWMHQDQFDHSSKQSNSNSGSPQGPLHLDAAPGGTSTTGGDSMEDEEDGKSETHSWKKSH